MIQATAILEYLRAIYPEWRVSYQLTQKWLEWTDRNGAKRRVWVGTEASKRCRELRSAGLLESEPEGRYEKFRAKPPKRWEVRTDRETGKVLARVPSYE